MISMYEIGESLNLDRTQTQVVCNYLRDEYLIEFKSLGGEIGMSHSGVVEMEELLLNPEKSTQHFLPINVLYVGQMTNSQIQQGTTNSNQTLVLNQNQIPDLNKIIEKLDELLSQNLNDSVNLKTDLETIKLQLKTQSPKQSIIKECLLSIKDFLINSAFSNALINKDEIIKQITDFLMSIKS